MIEGDALVLEAGDGSQELEVIRFLQRILVPNQIHEEHDEIDRLRRDLLVLSERDLPVTVRRLLRGFIVQINDDLYRLRRHNRSDKIRVFALLVIELDLQILGQRHENLLVVRNQLDQAIDRFRQVLALNLEERNQLEHVLLIRRVVLAQSYQQRVDILRHVHLKL